MPKDKNIIQSLFKSNFFGRTSQILTNASAYNNAIAPYLLNNNANQLQRFAFPVYKVDGTKYDEAEMKRHRAYELNQNLDFLIEQSTELKKALSPTLTSKSLLEFERNVATYSATVQKDLESAYTAWEGNKNIDTFIHTVEVLTPTFAEKIATYTLEAYEQSSGTKIKQLADAYQRIIVERHFLTVQFTKLLIIPFFTFTTVLPNSDHNKKTFSPFKIIHFTTEHYNNYHHNTSATIPLATSKQQSI